MSHAKSSAGSLCVPTGFRSKFVFASWVLLGDIPSPDYSVYAVDRHFFSSVSLFSVPCSDDHEQIFWTCNSGLRVTFDADYASIASQYRNSYYLVLCTTVWHASVEKHRNRVAFTLLICERGPKGFPPPEGCFIRNASMLKKYCLKCLIWSAIRDTYYGCLSNYCCNPLIKHAVFVNLLTDNALQKQNDANRNFIDLLLLDIPLILVLNPSFDPSLYKEPQWLYFFLNSPKDVSSREKALAKFSDPLHLSHSKWGN